MGCALAVQVDLSIMEDSYMAWFEIHGRFVVDRFDDTTLLLEIS